MTIKLRFRYIVAIPLLLLLVGMAAFAMSPAAANTTPLTIEGTGSLTTHVVTISTPIDSCITLWTRSPETGPPNSATFTGIMATNTDGNLETHFLINTCSNPQNLNPSFVTYTLNDVTVSCPTTPIAYETCPAGTSKTGGIVIVGEVTNLGTLGTPGTDSFIHLTVVSGSGGLMGVTGRGMLQGSATLAGFQADYWIQLTFAN